MAVLVKARYEARRMGDAWAVFDTFAQTWVSEPGPREQVFHRVGRINREYDPD